LVYDYAGDCLRFGVDDIASDLNNFADGFTKDLGYASDPINGQGSYRVYGHYKYGLHVYYNE
jgi:hypothetical protein